jgi:hypothetical protein
MVGTVNDDSTPPDDSISRIDALALVGGSMGYDEAGSADYLADCARGLLGQGRVEWTSHNEIIIDCVVGPSRKSKTGFSPPAPSSSSRPFGRDFGNRLVGATPASTSKATRRPTGPHWFS